MHCVNFVGFILKGIFLFFVFLYRFIVSPVFQFLMPEFSCKYPQSCSEFAVEELKKPIPASHALARITARILSCGPWHSPNWYRPKEKES